MHEEFQEELEPLNIAYAETFLREVEHLARAQEALKFIPPQLKKLLIKQDKSFLYGSVTAVQAIYDLMGLEVLTLAGSLLDPELQDASQAETPEERLKERAAMGEQMAQVAAGLVGIAEALGVISCRELVKREQEA